MWYLARLQDTKMYNNELKELSSDVLQEVKDMKNKHGRTGMIL